MVTVNKATLGSNKGRQFTIILQVVLICCLRFQPATAQNKAASLAEFKNANFEGKMQFFDRDHRRVILINVGSLQVPQINNRYVRRDLFENRRPR
jgi:hypothetical protein